ncbi:MAG: tRNA preQ1(34) S-adenosylmethionine ribosyltransferase-isomerase QueA [Acidobacteria bacterium]|nr:tRNA preQ1(34) S-adenosylmethionine ribosyltransferase-isomerase QueA [Acidobacteriota bacterium]MCA1649503.1 tRNA preQ1(34) S-adenosylmethionine ribosyltransferase-isomerase QueA [Acidobacteriota bacterium]
MEVSEFDYALPTALIAQEAAPRGASRLLVLHRATGAIDHANVSDLIEYLRRGDVLAVNTTRVFAARLLGRRVPSGGAVECLLLGPSACSSASARDPGTTGAPPDATKSALYCDALVHPGQKLNTGAVMRFEGDAGVLMAEVLQRRFHGRRTIRLWAESGGDVDRLVDALGHIPLPPYIRRPDTASDAERYQTIFAAVRGSVAAPTAGLHFTPEMVAALERAGVERAEIVLHVGYGTFKPVRTTTVEDHVVDSEPYDIPDAAAAAINRARAERRRVIAVGTTTTRALEAAARTGGPVSPGPGTASLFIYPGFQFQVLGGLMTNFHLPRSSLLMLVCAFAGRERVMAAYEEAVRRGYRFYSYGDAMLII